MMKTYKIYQISIEELINSAYEIYKSDLDRALYKID